MNNQNKFPFWEQFGQNYRNEISDSSFPLELKFLLRKAEINAQGMTKKQLYSALMNLYFQRLMEWRAIKDLILIEGEKNNLEYILPTDLNLQKLAEQCTQEDDDEDLSF